MKLFDPTSELALRMGDTTYSFHELQLKMDSAWIEFQKLSSGIQNPVLVRFTHDIATLSLVLACLQKDQPVALIDAEISASEKAKKWTLLPPGLDWDERRACGENSSAQLHPHTCLILLTSGSSGQPKAVQLSKENINANTAAVIESLRFEKVQIQHLFLPLSYSFGFLGQLLPALQLQIPTHLYRDFGDFFRSGNLQNAVGMISGVPSHWETILRALAQPNDKATHLVSAGARLSPDLRKRMRQSFPNALLFNNYGQTEASPRMLSMSSLEPRFFEDIVGRPVRGWQMRIHENGTLEGRGPQVMLGYVGDQRAPDWLNTGDLAEIENDGLIRILGRKDDLIKVSGERVSIAELESTFQAALNGVELAVLHQEDSLRGSTLSLFIVNSSLNDGEIRQRIEQHCGRQRLPKSLIRLDSLPRLTNGKVDRNSLRKLLT